MRFLFVNEFTGEGLVICKTDFLPVRCGRYEKEQ